MSVDPASVNHFNRKDFYCGAALSAAAAGLYLAFPTRNYVFEGLARAMPVELGLWDAVFRGNYLLYGFVGSVFHSFLRLAGYSGLAINSLQAMDGLLGAAGLFIFFSTLRRLGAGRYSAAVWSGILGTCFGYWRWSTDAENYIFSTFLLQINFLFLLLYAKGRGSPMRLGILHAMAIFGHIVNCVFAPVSIWFLISRHRREWKRPVLRYLMTTAGVVIAVYGAVLRLVVRPPDSVKAWRWLMGSFYTGGGGVGWHGGLSPGGIWQWMEMTAHIFTSFQPEYHSPSGWAVAGPSLWIARIILAACAAAAIRFAPRMSGEKRTAAIGCCIWLAAYAAVFTSWEPYTMVYRISDLVPFCLLLFLGYDAACVHGGRGALGTKLWKNIAPAFLVVALGLGNFGAEIYPTSFASNNPDLTRMAFIKAHTVDGDWVAGEGGRDELYIPFFAERRPLLIGRFTGDPGEFIRRVDSLLALGQGVYVTSRVLMDPHWDQLFRRFGPQTTARDAEGFTLYRLTERASH